MTDVFKDTPLWDLSTITREDVSSTIDALKPTLSTGPDKIPNKLLKSLKFEALDAITLVFNKCIEEGVFPDIWKSGKIIPTYKKGAKNKIQNYRPVCLFSNLGKLFEGVVKRQLTVHLERILPPNVFGFRPGRSTQDAVFYAMDKIHRQRAEGKLTAVVSLDASSAFDCVPHEIIIRSLEIIGAGQKMQRWIESFLKGCYNFVQIGDAASSEWSVESGSGQGRRLSPDLFNITCLSQALLCLISEFIGYADDGMDIVAGSSPAECNANLKTVVQERVEWYKKIGLPLNIDKTEIMGFGFEPSPVEIGDITIYPKNEMTFLGIKIQNNLKWSSQISLLCNKIRSAAGRIRVDGRNLTTGDKRMLYMGWIQGLIFSNSPVVLATISSSELSDLQTACNAGIRAMVGIPKYGYADITAIRKKFRIPSVEDIVEYSLQCSAWKFFAHCSFERPGPMTRSKANMILPHPDQRGHHAKISENLFVQAWNRIPLPVKKADKLQNVKYHLKRTLF